MFGRLNNKKKQGKNNKSPKLCLRNLIIIIINGAKTISLQTLFGRLNYWKNPEKTARYDRIINELCHFYKVSLIKTGVIWYFEPHGKLNPGSIYLWYFDPGFNLSLWYFDPGVNFLSLYFEPPHGKLNPPLISTKRGVHNTIREGLIYHR